MPASRTARLLARCVLAWFALYLGAAVATPLVARGGYAVVCSADGTARLVRVDDGGVPAGAHASLHCPLCVPASAPPPPAELIAATPPQPLVDVRPRATSARPPALAGAPPPARGPPLPT